MSKEQFGKNGRRSVLRLMDRECTGVEEVGNRVEGFTLNYTDYLNAVREIQELDLLWLNGHRLSPHDAIEIWFDTKVEVMANEDTSETRIASKEVEGGDNTTW